MAQQPQKKMVHRARPEDLVGMSHEAPPETSRRRKARRKPKISVPALNITSFLDMSFCLLLFLILTASFSQGEGVLTASLPTGTGTGGASDPLNRPININLFPGGVDGSGVRISVQNTNQAISSFTNLADVLRGLQAPNGPYPDTAPVLIKPDQAVRWQHVVNAFNSAIRARFKNVNFAQAVQ